MRWLIAVLLFLLVALQVSLWFGDGSLVSAWRLQERIEQQQKENEQLAERNRILEAEVNDLKQGVDAIEERARSELGMVKQGETFYQIVEEKP